MKVQICIKNIYRPRLIDIRLLLGYWGGVPNFKRVLRPPVYSTATA